MPDNPEQQIARHYKHGSLLQTIFAALNASGLAAENFSPDDLAPVDEFHIGGRMATAEFATQMGVVPGMRLLDIGSGIGGPARYFAGHCACLVTGIDLSDEFCETAKELSSRTGLGDRTEYRQAGATSLPFDDATFDGAYMLHVGMNIPAKADVFREVARVLKPGSMFGIFDVMREAGGDLTFPVPWANTPETSFVETAATYTELLRAAGFAIEKRRGRRAFALEFFARMRDLEGVKPLGLPILMGPSAPVKIGNLVNLIERGVLAPVELVSRKH